MIKVAFPTDDGETISAHLGQAQYYVVAEIGGDNSSLDRRPKPNHASHDENAHVQHDHAGGGFAHAMFAPISDCQVLIAGGMGQPAYQQAVSNGLQVLLTGEKSITGALAAYQSGALASDMRRVHHAH